MINNLCSVAITIGNKSAFISAVLPNSVPPIHTTQAPLRAAHVRGGRGVHMRGGCACECMWEEGSRITAEWEYFFVYKKQKLKIQGKILMSWKITVS